MTREDLLKALERIGWKKISEMNGYAWKVENHEGEESNILLMSDCVSIDYHRANVRFYYKDSALETIDDNCVSLFANNGVFINFYGKADELSSKEKKDAQ